MSFSAAARAGTIVAGLVSGVAAFGPATAQQPPAAGNDKIEVTTIDAWVLTCRMSRKDNARACSAQARIIQTDKTTQQSRVVFTWIIGQQDRKTFGVFQMPTGVFIGPGVEVQVGKDFKRKFEYSQCTSSNCEAVTPFDDALVKVLQSSPTLDATIISTDRQQVKFSLNLKGIDKVLAEVRK